MDTSPDVKPSDSTVAAVLPPPGTQLPAHQEEQLKIHDFAARFSIWHRGRTNAHAPSFGDVLEWAKEQKIELTASNIRMLAAVRDEAVRIFYDQQQWISSAKTFELKFDALETFRNLRDREPQKKTSHEADDDPAARSTKEREDREAREREAVRSVMIFRPLCPDSSAIKDLSWRLTTGHIPSEEIQNVIAFLNWIKETSGMGGCSPERAPKKG